MTPTTSTSPNLGAINALLAERGYEVSEPAPDTITIKELDSGVSIQAVLEGDILFLTLPCITVARTAVTPEIMATMLASDNGVSTSSFQLYDAGDGKVTVTDGPFIESKEVIGGYAEVEVADLDEALAMAKEWPGTVEIRPVVDHSQER